MKNTVLTTNTPYPSWKIRRIRAYTSQETTKNSSAIRRIQKTSIRQYIKLQAEKAQRRGQMFNWETATYGKSYGDDLDFFTGFKADYPAIVYNDALTSNENVPSKPPVSIYNAIKVDIDFSISFSDSDDEDYTFICDKNSFSYKLIPINDLKPEPVNDHVEINTELCSKNVDIKPMDSVVCISNHTTLVESDECLETNHNKKRELSEIYSPKPLYGVSASPIRHMALPPRDQRYQYLRFEGLEYTNANIVDFEERMLMEHRDAQVQSVLTSRAWGRLFRVRGPLVHELILEFFSTFRFGEAVLDLDTVGAL
ncbi:hypothetical protein Tco_1041673 [Tanacetum coccineum]|uniref:Uncharacterized protein n=1 Tax=Tanacetum coccineum TaxID=301880 RepID=A0ABQ5GJG7_9ASTR